MKRDDTKNKPHISRSLGKTIENNTNNQPTINIWSFNHLAAAIVFFCYFFLTLYVHGFTFTKDVHLFDLLGFSHHFSQRTFSSFGWLKTHFYLVIAFGSDYKMNVWVICYVFTVIAHPLIMGADELHLMKCRRFAVLLYKM